MIALKPRSPVAAEAIAMSEEEALTKAHLAAIAFIEANLFEPMTVKSIAAFDSQEAVRSARESIRARHLPQSGHALGDSLPFERFPQGLRVTAGSFVDYCFPVRT